MIFLYCHPCWGCFGGAHNEGCYGNKWAMVLRDKEILEVIACLPTSKGRINHLPFRMKWLWGMNRGKALRPLSSEQEYLLVLSSQCLPDVLFLPSVEKDACGTLSLSAHSVLCLGNAMVSTICGSFSTVCTLFALCSFNFSEFTSGCRFIEQHLWASPGACPSCRIPQKNVLWFQMILGGSWLAVMVGQMSTGWLDAQPRDIGYMT